MDIFFMAIYPHREEVFFNTTWLEYRPNRLADPSARDSQFAEGMKLQKTGRWFSARIIRETLSA
jgi:hypothetical protein